MPWYSPTPMTEFVTSSLSAAYLDKAVMDDWSPKHLVPQRTYRALRGLVLSLCFKKAVSTTYLGENSILWIRCTCSSGMSDGLSAGEIPIRMGNGKTFPDGSISGESSDISLMESFLIRSIN